MSPLAFVALKYCYSSSYLAMDKCSGHAIVCCSIFTNYVHDTTMAVPVPKTGPVFIGCRIDCCNGQGLSF